MKTNIKRIDTLVALYNKSLLTATHERLMYLCSLLTMYCMEEYPEQKWGIVVVPCEIGRVHGKMQVIQID